MLPQAQRCWSHVETNPVERNSLIKVRDLESIAGQDVYGADGGKIGTAGQVYVDDETGRPEWVTVRTGFFGANESFVPLADASVSGGRVTVPYDKDKVKNAPNVDPEGRHLDVSEEQSLYQYYGANYGQGAGYADAGRRRTTKRSDDDAMTVSEERLKVGREKEAAGKVRLRKYVVTEQQNVTVPVTREEVRLERELVPRDPRRERLEGLVQALRLLLVSQAQFDLHTLIQLCAALYSCLNDLNLLLFH